MQDSLEEALDVIDEKHTNIAEICKRPLFYDSMEVRGVLNDIKDTRLALHSVAHALSSSFKVDDAERADNEG